MEILWMKKIHGPLFVPESAEKKYANSVTVKVRAAKEEKNGKVWSFLLVTKLGDPLEGKIMLPKSKPAGVVLLTVADMFSNPSSPHLPEGWIDAFERRLMWAEVSQEIRTIQTELHGMSHTAH